MPKKVKKNGEKQDENKKAQTVKTNLDFAANNASEKDKEKSVFLAQIQFLNGKLERYEQKCDELERQNKDLNRKYSALETEKEDIVDFLRHSLLEKDKEVDDLSERLETVQQEAQKEQNEIQQEYEERINQLQCKTEAVTTENTALMEKMTHVEQFLKERDQLMSSLEALKKQLSRQEEEHQVALHNLDMKALVDKKRLEKELENHVASMEAEVQCLVNQKLPETTSQALQENKELKAHFSHLSEHARSLVEKNTALEKRKTELGLDVENLEQMLKEVSRKNCIQKKVVEQLTKKCEQIQTELSHCRQKHQQLHSQHSQSMDEMEILRQDNVSVSKQFTENQADISRLKAELQLEKKRSSEMKTTIQKASIVLTQALTEVDVEDFKDRVDRWKILMQKLLGVLNKPLRSDTTNQP